MDQVTSELTLEHIAGSPELNAIHHDRVHKRIKQPHSQHRVIDAQLPAATQQGKQCSLSGLLQGKSRT